MKRYSGASLTADTGANSAAVALDTLDVDDDSNADFVAGQGVILSDGSYSTCARIQAISGTSLTLDRGAHASRVFRRTDTTAVPALIYEISGGALLRNGITLSRDVDDIQIEFGVDANANGQVQGAEFPLHTLDAADLDRVKMARVTVTVRSDRPDPDFDGQFTAVANRVAGAADNIKRRRAMGETLLKNVD